MTMRSGCAQQAARDQSFGQLVMAQQVRDERAFAAFGRDGVVVEQHADVVDEHVDLAARSPARLRSSARRIGLQREIAALGVDPAEAGCRRVTAQLRQASIRCGPPR